MKKHLFLFAFLTLSVFIISCGGNKSSEEVAQDGTSADSLGVSEEKHAFYGIYQGILPCGNCTGIQTVIHLMEDSTYTKRFIYLGRDTDEVQVEEGTITWNPDGTVVTLTGPSASIQYLVSVDKITQLAQNGQPYQGSDAGQYILNRTEIMTPTPEPQE
ncbi:MAG: copper resistance protein NlpE N-terminal domain-containing protein [Saprospiraceae bacterium]|nr:copper resistance protein NlpE N-terminal domain-containing protein [Saprospiraceae bacterium]